MRRLTAIFCLLFVTMTPTAIKAREVVDMAGRHVTIPDRATRVYSSSHPISVLLYALAPDLLTGINFPVRDELKPYLPKAVIELPVIGAAMGHGPQMNPEEVMALHPDFVLVWQDRFSDTDRIVEQYEKTGLPVLLVRLDTLADHPAALAFLGNVLERPERAKALSAYIEDAMARVRKAVGDIPPEKRRRVYYAEMKNGLATECDKSWHAEAIVLAGGDNVHHCEQTTHGGDDPINQEQIIAYQPDFILAQSQDFVSLALSDPSWRAVPAVRTKAIAVAPKLPFNWIDRPPSFMRAIGVQWLAHLLYPDRFPFDANAETRKFYKLFLDVDLTDDQLAHVLP